MGHIKKVKLFLYTVVFTMIIFLSAKPAHAALIKNNTIEIEYQKTKALNDKNAYTNRPDIIQIKNKKITGLSPGKAIIYTNNKKINITVTRKTIKRKKPVYVTKGHTKKITNNPCTTKERKIFHLKNGCITGKKPGKANIVIKTKYKRIIQPIVIESPRFSQKKYHVNGEYAKINLSNTHEKVKYVYDDYYIEREPKKFYLYEDYGLTKITAKINKRKIDACKLYIGNIIPYTTEINTGKSIELYSKATRPIIDFDLKIDNPAIATITKTGKLTGKKKGITTLRTRVMGKTYTGTIIVTNNQKYYTDIKIKKIADFRPWISPMLYKALCQFKIDYHITDILPAFPNDRSIAGYINITEHDIYIRSDQNSADMTFHELGHFFDHLKNYLSGTPKFQKIYRKEAFKNKTYYRDYARTNSNEYLADAFVYYIFEPSLMKEKSPETHAIIDNAYRSITDEEIQNLIKRYPKKNSSQIPRALINNLDDDRAKFDIEYDPILPLR